MANKWYPKGLDAFASGGVAWLSDTIKAALVSSASYTPNFTTDQYWNVVPGGAVIAAGVALGSKTLSLGVVGAANTIWTSVSGAQAAYVLIYKDTGTSSTSPLLGFIDTATGLPVTPNGGDITAAWSGGTIATLFQGFETPELVQLPRAPRPEPERGRRWGRKGWLWVPEPMGA